MSSIFSGLPIFKKKEAKTESEISIERCQKIFNSINLVGISKLFKKSINIKGIDFNLVHTKPIFVYEDQPETENRYLGMYLIESQEIKLNSFEIEKAAKRFMNLYKLNVDDSLHAAMVSVYIHELWHLNSDMKDDEFLGNERHVVDEKNHFIFFRAFNEAMTELLTQVVVSNYLKDRFDIDLKSEDISYLNYATLLNSIIKYIRDIMLKYEMVDDETKALEAVWGVFCEAYMSTDLTAKYSHIDFIEDFFGKDFTYILGGLGYDKSSGKEKKQILILLKTLQYYREKNNLSALDINNIKLI